MLAFVTTLWEGTMGCGTAPSLNTAFLDWVPKLNMNPGNILA